MIELCDTFCSGYNSTLGGEGKCGHKVSEETKRKISVSNSGNNNGQYGKTPSTFTKKKLSQATKRSWTRDKKQRSLYQIRGEQHHNSKLTRELVKEIRSKYVPYKYSCSKLAQEYNIHPTTIHAIITNKIWKE